MAQKDVLKICVNPALIQTDQPSLACSVGLLIAPLKPVTTSISPRTDASIPAGSVRGVKSWSAGTPASVSAIASPGLSQRPWRALWQPTHPVSAGG